MPPRSPDIPLAQRVVFLAASQVGLREAGGPNKGPPLERYAGGRSEPWCAHFVAWLFREVGRALPGDVKPSVKQHNPVASVKTMWGELEAAKMSVAEPDAGDIVVFHNRVGSDPGAGWHVGLVSAVLPSRRIQTIEGNSGDAVARRTYDIEDHRILGFARVGQ